VKSDLRKVQLDALHAHYLDQFAKRGD
jgi:hypothetical protein